MQTQAYINVEMDQNIDKDPKETAALITKVESIMNTELRNAI